MKNCTVNNSGLEFYGEKYSDSTTDRTRKHSGVISQIREHQKVNQHTASAVDKLLLEKVS